MQTISIRAGQWTPAAKSVVRWIDENENIDRLVQKHGSTENYAITQWHLPTSVAALIFEHYQR